MPSLPIGSVLALVGGLAVVSAFFMPWFGVQGLLLSGSFLGRFLGSASDVQRFMPALAGNPGEIRLLRALVYFFPACGALAALMALLHGVVPAERRTRVALVLVASGLAPLVALLIGVTRLPAGATLEVGLWLIGAGSAAVILGPLLNRLLAR